MINNLKVLTFLTVSLQRVVYSQLYCCQKLQQVSTIHVVQVEQQVFTVSSQFNCSQLKVEQQKLSLYPNTSLHEDCVY